MAGPGKRVLLVDDDEDVLFAVRAMLEAAGHQVTAARGTKEALACLPGLQVDVAIVDLMMEETDSGVQVAQAIRLRPETRDLPILLLTAVTETTGFRVPLETAEEREWLQVDAWLDKPVTAEQLLRAVAEVRHA